MDNELYLSYDWVDRRVEALAWEISTKSSSGDGRIALYGVPRGGVPVAYAIAGHLRRFGTPVGVLVSDPTFADFFVDDIIDSGATKRRYTEKYGKPFYALVDKEVGEYPGKWMVFPWEVKEDTPESVEDNVTRIIQFIGEDSSREGLRETPNRVVKAWEQWASGYGKNAADVLKTFEDGAEACDEMVMVRDIPFYSKCEHHMADIFGTVTIAYIPNGRIVGLSKLSRLADMYARRLQVQERFTNQIADALNDNLSPLGVGVIVKARHMCMESRGVCQQGHTTITSALRGAIKSDPQARGEFLKLAE